MKFTSQTSEKQALRMIFAGLKKAKVRRSGLMVQKIIQVNWPKHTWPIHVYNLNIGFPLGRLPGSLSKPLRKIVPNLRYHGFSIVYGREWYYFEYEVRKKKGERWHQPKIPSMWRE